MIWNWQKENWPDFSYEKSKLVVLEQQFLQESGVLRGSFVHIKEAEKKQLIVELISTEAIKTSEIEGEYLNRDSVQSSIRRHFGLKTDNRKISATESGIAEMMLNLYENFADTLSHKTLHGWHEMLYNGRRDIRNIGAYRRHAEPMQVISGAIHKPKIHFEAPPSANMKQEMRSFLQWFNKSNKTLPPLARAAIAHLYFVSIHPFEDGNGRIARALSEKTLAQTLGYPTLICLSNQIEKDKKRYYAMLEKSNKDMQVTEWVLYFSDVILQAQKDTQRKVEFIISKTKLLENLRDKLNGRQQKAILRLFEAGTDGFSGGLSAANYQAITGATTATTTRDLHDLVEKGALTRTGELKHTRYWLKL